DLFTAPELKAAIVSAIEAGRTRLVVDLSETTFLDSTALGVLIGALKRLRTRDGAMTLVNRDANIAKTVEITGLDQIFVIAETRPLGGLEEVGLPIVPTHFVAPGEEPDEMPAHCVVKPAVSAGSRDTSRHEDRAAAEAHVRALTDAGRVAMVQPYLDEVDEAGETALLYCEGAFSHAIRKGPLLLAGPATVEGLFAPENITRRDPRPVEREVG